jgi:hypothetical protein
MGGSSAFRSDLLQHRYLARDAVIPNVGDWGWLIGAALAAVFYITPMRREAPALSRPGVAAY